MDAVKTAVEKKERRTRGGALPAIRELQTMTEASTLRVLEVAKTEGEKLTRKAEEAITAARLAEAQAREEDIQLRAKLNSLTGGMIEHLVKQGPEDIREFFRRKGWRV